MVATLYRINGHPSFIIYCFIGIFQNRDPPPGAQTNRGTMLKDSWHASIMVDTSHRKYGHPSFITYGGTMLKKSWYTPTMVDTFHRKK